MEPIVDRVKAKYEPRIREFEIINITTDRGREKVEEFGVTLTPTFVILDKSDTEVDRLIGGAKQETLEKFIDQSIENQNE